ncbi:MAG: DUF1449 family protein [Pirellulaceae bacterium]
MELLNTLFSGPVLPASALLCFMLVWSLMAMLGAVDLDLPGADINVDADVDFDVDMNSGSGPTDGLGLLAAKWLNIANVPLVMWLGIFAVIWWLTSALLWVLVDAHFFAPPGWIWSSVLVAKNLAIGIVLTKLVTNPMGKWFVVERISAAAIVGKECQISSLEATPEFGQVKFKTDGSPLLLNVRTDGPHLVQGTTVWITHYDAKRRVYIVSPTGTETTTE